MHSCWACGGAAQPTSSTGAVLQNDFYSATCLFGSLEASTTQGYECVDGEFRAWIDNDRETYDFIAASAGEAVRPLRNQSRR